MNKEENTIIRNKMMYIRELCKKTEKEIEEFEKISIDNKNIKDYTWIVDGSVELDELNSFFELIRELKEIDYITKLNLNLFYKDWDLHENELEINSLKHNLKESKDKLKEFETKQIIQDYKTRNEVKSSS